MFSSHTVKMAAVVAAGLLLTGCGLFGGGSGLSDQCETAAKTAAADYVDLVVGQSGEVSDSAVQLARTAAAEAIRPLDDACTADEKDAATSLFVTTVAYAADVQQDGQKAVLYAGLDELCETESPRREVSLSAEAQAACGRAATDAAPAEPVEDPVLGGTRPYQLRYTLEGTGRATVRFLTGDGTEAVETVQLPWSWEDEAVIPQPTMSATVENGQVVCAIYVDDQRRAEGGVNPDSGTLACSFDAALALTQSGGQTVPPIPPELEGFVNDVLAQNPAQQP